MAGLDLGEPTGRDMRADAELLARYERRPGGMTPEQSEMFLLMVPSAGGYRQLVQALARRLLESDWHGP